MTTATTCQFAYDRADGLYCGVVATHVAVLAGGTARRLDSANVEPFCRTHADVASYTEGWGEPDYLTVLPIEGWAAVPIDGGALLVHDGAIIGTIELDGTTRRPVHVGGHRLAVGEARTYVARGLTVEVGPGYVQNHSIGSSMSHDLQGDVPAETFADIDEASAAAAR